MKFHYLTIVPEDKDKPIKIVCEDDVRVTQTSDFTIEFVKKLRGIEAEKFIKEMFGTTKVGVFDCSGMSDEEREHVYETLSESAAGH